MKCTILVAKNVREVWGVPSLKSVPGMDHNFPLPVRGLASRPTGF